MTFEKLSRFLLLMVIAPLSAVAAGDEIADAQDLNRLLLIAQATESRIRRVKACEIQRREHVAPTFCYSGSEKHDRELDSLCISLSSRASRLPRMDQLTSKSCRRAIERRAEDLAYAAARDALRQP